MCCTTVIGSYVSYGVILGLTKFRRETRLPSSLFFLLELGCKMVSDTLGDFHP